MFGFDMLLQNWTVHELSIAFGTIISFSSVESTFMMPIRLFWRQYHFAVVAIKMFIHSSLFLTWNPKMVGKSGFWDKCFVALGTLHLRFVKVLFWDMKYQDIFSCKLFSAIFTFEFPSFMGWPPMSHHWFFLFEFLVAQVTCKRPFGSRFVLFTYDNCFWKCLFYHFFFDFQFGLLLCEAYQNRLTLHYFNPSWHFRCEVFMFWRNFVKISQMNVQRTNGNKLYFAEVTKMCFWFNIHYSTKNWYFCLCSRSRNLRPLTLK